MSLKSKSLLISAALLFSACGASIEVNSLSNDVDVKVALSSDLYLIANQKVQTDSFTASISGCTSGLQYSFTSPSSISTANLIKGDTSCVLIIDEFSIAGKSFTTSSYDPTTGSYNTFTASDGQSVFLVPETEIPSPITSIIPDLTATVLATDSGTPFQIDAPTTCNITITNLGVVKRSSTRFRIDIPNPYVLQSSRVRLFPCGQATTSNGCRRKQKTPALSLNFRNRYRKAGPHTIEVVVQTDWDEDLLCKLENVLIPKN